MRLLSAVTVLCVGSAFLPAGASAADARSCALGTEASISVELKSAPPDRDLSRGSRELTAVPGRGPVPPGAMGRPVLGLSTARIVESSSIDVRVVSLPDGSFCGVVSAIRATFGFDGRRVSIARELPEGSCVFGEVLAHELKHVRVDDEAVRAYLPRLEERLRAEARTAAPVRARDQRSVVETERRRVRTLMRSALDEFTRERDRLQAGVDTTEEYKRVTASCGGEAARYIPAGSGRM